MSWCVESYSQFLTFVRVVGWSVISITFELQTLSFSAAVRPGFIMPQRVGLIVLGSSVLIVQLFIYFREN